jgi:hypothetical protein
MSTVRAKETSTNTERCDRCRLWFEFLHPSADGRFLCRMCLTLEGGNRAAPLQPVTRRKTDGWLLQPSRRGGGMDARARGLPRKRGVGIERPIRGSSSQ